LCFLLGRARPYAANRVNFASKVNAISPLAPAVLGNGQLHSSVIPWPTDEGDNVRVLLDGPDSRNRTGVASCLPWIQRPGSTVPPPGQGLEAPSPAPSGPGYLRNFSLSRSPSLGRSHKLDIIDNNQGNPTLCFRPACPAHETINLEPAMCRQSSTATWPGHRPRVRFGAAPPPLCAP
jgi:hypothetical protein